MPGIFFFYHSSHIVSFNLYNTSARKAWRNISYFKNKENEAVFVWGFQEIDT